MGMFDEIKFEKPFKCTCGEKLKICQTKDFSPSLDSYKINKKNDLEILECEYEEIANEKRPLFKKINTKWTYYPFIGKIKCYTSCDNCEKWHSIDLEFDNGKLIYFEHRECTL